MTSEEVAAFLHSVNCSTHLHATIVVAAAQGFSDEAEEGLAAPPLDTDEERQRRYSSGRGERKSPLALVRCHRDRAECRTHRTAVQGMRRAHH